MPILSPIGRVDNPEDLDLDPVVVPVVGYNADREEVIFEVIFRAMQPTGEAMDLLKVADAAGNVPIGIVFAYLDACVTEDNREAWQKFLHGPDLNIEQSTIIELYKTISSYYADRPTQQRSVSHNGRVTSGKTSRAAARSKGSTSKVSPSTKG
jgi:hypothetical protein